MSFFEHLEELRRRLRVVVAFLLLFFLLFIVFDFDLVDVGGVPVPVPVPAFLQPEGTNFADRVFLSLVDYYKPPDVNLTQLHPWDGVVVEIKVAFFLALIATSPVSAYEFAKFLGPALKPSEKRLIIRVAAPVLALFLSGVTVAHVFVLPFTFDFLYSVARRLGADFLLLFIDDFVSFVLAFLVLFGLSFEMPVIMYGLSSIGLVDSGFWKRNWRFAAIAIFFFAAVITPDASGVTMMIVSLPMLVLYVVGYVAVVQRERRGPAKSS